MTKKTRRKFTSEQKQKAVPQIAQELDCDVQNICRWRTLQEEKNITYLLIFVCGWKQE